MDKQTQTLVIVLVVIVLAIVGYKVLNAPDQRTTGERIGDAVDALPEGLGKAADQLEDKSAGEKIGDALDEAGDKIQDATDGH